MIRIDVSMNRSAYVHSCLYTHNLLLEIRRLPIKDVHRLHPMINHPQRPIKESHQMTGSFSTLTHELLTITLSNGNQELVERHGSIDGYFTTKEGFDVVSGDGVGSFILDQRGQT